MDNESSEHPETLHVKTTTPTNSILWPALIGALVTLILSPISIWLGFYLDSYFSRSKLSIEYAGLVEAYSYADMSAEIANLPMRTINGKLLVDLDLLSKTLFQNRAEAARAEEQYRLLLTYWQDQSKLIEKVDTEAAENIEEIKTLLSLNSIERSLVDNVPPDGVSKYLEPIRKSKLDFADKNTNAAKAALSKFRDSANCRMYITASILNRGGSDGLIRSVAVVEDSSGERQSFVISSPPKFEGVDLMSVSVNIANRKFEEFIPRNTVGQIAKNSIENIWWAPESPNCDFLPELLELRTNKDAIISVEINQ